MSCLNFSPSSSLPSHPPTEEELSVSVEDVVGRCRVVPKGCPTGEAGGGGWVAAPLWARAVACKAPGHAVAAVAAHASATCYVGLRRS